MLEKWLKPIVEKLVIAMLPNVLMKLDPKGNYILILPDDGGLEKDEISSAFAPLHDQGINLVVLITNNAKLLEL